MADCYTWLAVFGWSEARQAMPQARQTANRALELDETLAAAHVSLGNVKALYNWDWPGAEREFKSALELSPGDADTHFAYSVTYHPTGTPGRSAGENPTCAGSGSAVDLQDLRGRHDLQRPPRV
jgi:tetratricopeptide (TPR) repeat protein